METDYYLAADKRFFEPFDARPVEASDYLDYVSAAIDDGWRIIRKGIWINCLSDKNALPMQGFKIHLSSVPQDSVRLLQVTAAYLIKRGVSFKFLADMKTLKMTSAKSWTRGGSGKFITIYPLDFAQFKLLLEELEPLTREFRGPYILSDRRYKDSKVLYYRFGGIKMNARLQADGSLLPVLIAPDGRELEDARNPTYGLPAWVEEPFPAAKDPNEGAALNNGRYTVEKALQFSNSGGVYIALDSVTGKRVVLKEARAHVYNFFDDADAADMLRHEFALLKRLEDCGAAPKPIELFQEWEHLFLAEEYFEGYLPLRKFSAQASVFLETRPTREKIAQYLKNDLLIVSQLAAIVDAMHARGVVWGDISFNNILVDPATLDVKIIDLESAHVMGSETKHRIITPGFFDAAQSIEAAPTVADDYYGVGSVLLFLLTHVNGILGLKPRVWKEMLAEVARDFGLPPELARVVSSLLSEDASRRPKPSALIAESMSCFDKIGEIRFESEDYAASFPRAEMSEMVHEICRFVKANADLHRKDRLFPADAMVYQTNPLGLAHGAAGVLYGLSKVEGSVAPELSDWLTKTDASADGYPPGLFHGLAGIAWALLEMGQVPEAEATLAKSFDHPLLAVSPDLYHGIAGWGMANLKFWLKTKNQTYLDRAQEVGRALLKTAQTSEDGLYWPTKDGVVHYGLGHGASGIGLFLLYLDRAVGGGRYEEAAVKAFDYDLAQAVEMPGGGLSWRRSDEILKIVYPYLKSGSAGVGVVALRFLKAIKNPRYRDIIEKIHIDCDRKYTVFPGRNEGLAGLGEFLLDAYLETGDKKYLNSAYRAATGLKIFCMREKEGAAFPGSGLTRVSCDLATGSIGIALFLDRLQRPRSADFLLDELLS